MTSRPRPKIGPHLLPAVAAVALFAVMAAAVLTSSFGPAQGFPADANVVASIGRAMFGLPGAEVAGESFLVAFEIVDLVLVAALAGAVLLARREEGGSTVALLADGGRRLVGRDQGDDD
ncbi:MAG: proton-conducting membrane transporter [Haloferacaceae archaeon]